MSASGTDPASQSPLAPTVRQCRSPWICDVCGGDVQQRADDTPDAVHRRLDLYETQTAPLIDHYSRRGEMVVINGIGHPDHVFKRVCDVVDARRQA